MEKFTVAVVSDGVVYWSGETPATPVVRSYTLIDIAPPEHCGMTTPGSSEPAVHVRDEGQGN
jgi:hypothetical protein